MRRQHEARQSHKLLPSVNQHTFAGVPEEVLYHVSLWIYSKLLEPRHAAA